MNLIIDFYLSCWTAASLARARGWLGQPRGDSRSGTGTRRDELESTYQRACKRRTPARSEEPMSSEREKAKTPAAGNGARSHDRRCGCGKLAARVTPQGVEIKCSRCKRVMLVSWSEVPGDGTPFSLADE